MFVLLIVLNFDIIEDTINQNNIKNDHQTIPLKPNWFAIHIPITIVAIVGITTIKHIIINTNTIPPNFK